MSLLTCGYSDTTSHTKQAASGSDKNILLSVSTFSRNSNDLTWQSADGYLYNLRNGLYRSTRARE